METLHTYLAVPVALSRAIAIFCYFIENLIRNTRLAYVEHLVEILILRAGNTLSPIKDGRLLRTWFAFMHTKVIDLILFTLIAYLKFIIEKIGKEAFNA
jgi:hypothetical protein